MACASALLVVAALLLGLPAASAQASPGINCTFTAPSGDYYDIAPLVSRGADDEFSDWTVLDTEGRYTYYWNSCRGVEARGTGTDPNFFCAPSDGGCQNDPDDPNAFFGLGKLASARFGEERPGFLAITYLYGSQAGGGSVRQLTVEIVCNQSAAEPYFEINSPVNGVNYLLRVESLHGCVKEPPAPPPPTPPPGTTNCTYVSPLTNNRYNIEALVNESGDWMFRDTEETYTYYWNSCEGVETRGSWDQCVAGVDAGCKRDGVNGGPFFSLGKLDNATFTEVVDELGPHLEVSYTGGAEVTDPLGGNYGQRSLRVDIQCWEELNTPLFRIITPPFPDTEYTVVVLSKWGCPIKNECTLATAAGERYDLAPLTTQTFTANSSETPFLYEYFIGICSSVSECAGSSDGRGAESSSCQINTECPECLPFNNGIAPNRTLMELPCEPPLCPLLGVRIVYSDGEICDAPGAPRLPRTTVVDVFCTPEVEPPVLKYIAESPPCTYSFALEAAAACPAAQDGNGTVVAAAAALAEVELRAMAAGRVPRSKAGFSRPL